MKATEDIMGNQIKEAEKEYIENCKLFGKWAGLLYQGLDEEGEPEFLGDKAQFQKYEEVKDKDVFEDDNDDLYFWDKNKDKIYLE